MRFVLAVLLLAAFVAAESLAPQQVAQVRSILGPDWDKLPEWRRKMILRRYAQFLKLPVKQQNEIRRAGMREFLIKPSDRFGRSKLPEALRRELEQLPPDVRPFAGKLAVLRLRQMRLDRNLALLPFERRRPMFRRLFPEPFDPGQARKGYREFQKVLAKVMAIRVQARLGKEEQRLGRRLTSEERRRLLSAETRREEERVVAAVAKELRRHRSRKPSKILHALEREGFHLLERIELHATPRQRELIRYAFRPEGCPLVRLRWLGPRPEEPKEKRRWERDFRTLARIDLLTEAGFPPEVVLHLAASGSPEEFFRAVKALYHRRR